MIQVLAFGDDAKVRDEILELASNFPQYAASGPQNEVSESGRVQSSGVFNLPAP